PRMGYTGFNPDYAYVFPDEATETGLDYFNAVTDQWTRDEYYAKVSTPNVADGQVYVWRNRQLKVNQPALATRYSDSTGPDYNTIFLPYYNQDGTRDVFVDNVYVDNTRARVEICDTATFPTGSSAGHCEVQIPSAWSTLSISVTVNQGSF